VALPELAFELAFCVDLFSLVTEGLALVPFSAATGVLGFLI
jgi:hypothetical protein